MNLKEKIQADFKEAFKSKDETRVSTLKILQSEIKNSEIEKKTKLSKANEDISDDKIALNDDEIITVIGREIKKRKDAMEIYEKENRPEQASSEKAEMEVLMSFMPEQMTEEKVRELVKKAIEQSGATGEKEMGKVMAILMPQVKGKADGALVSKIVKELLG